MLSSAEPTVASHKEACARPDVVPRSVVERTAAILCVTARTESTLVRSQFWSRVLEKPPLHRGGAENDRLVLGLAPEDVRAVYLALLAEMLRCEVEGEAYAHERHQLHSLYEWWEEYWFSVGAP